MRHLLTRPPRWTIALLVACVALLAWLIARLGDPSPSVIRVEQPASPAELAPQGECRLGTRDLNPDNLRVVPASGEQQLLAPREDGRLPFGFHDHAPFAGQVTTAESARLHRIAGSTLWRVAIDWRSAEPTRGQIDLSRHDDVYCAAVRLGIRPLFVITAAPGWAADSERACAADECHFPPRRDQLEALRRLSERVAIRYPQAAAIEAWNEPNLPTFWAEPDPELYVDVLRSVYGGVKDGNPAMPVLAGSISNAPATKSVTGRMSGSEFADRMYAAGAANAMDGISFHPYPIEALGSDDERFSESLRKLRAVLRRHDDDRRRIWVTEVGLRTPSQHDAEGGDTPESASPTVATAVQADSLLEIHRRLEQAGDVDAVIFHTLVDPGEGIVSAPGFGWVVPRRDGGFEPKPVYCAFARRFADPLPCDEPMRLTASEVAE